MTDFYFDDLDYRLNNPIYPTDPCAGLNPLDIFKAPDGHIYTPEEITTMMGGGINIPASDVNIDPNNMSIGQKTIEPDPNGGVVVTDIIGGKHHFPTMEQAMSQTDLMSGFPITEFHSNTQHHANNSDCHSCPNLPTDVHTPVDLSFYDNKIDEARSQLIDAEKQIAECDDPDKCRDAIRRAEDARNSIRYWEDCRRTEDYNRTIDNIKSDKLTNDVNKALNDLHNTLHHQ